MELDEEVTDIVAVTDTMAVAFDYGRLHNDTVILPDVFSMDLYSYRVLGDTAAVSDTVEVGYVREVWTQDTAGVSDQIAPIMNYVRSAGDDVLVEELIHPWMTVDGTLGVDLQGGSDLSAVLLKRRHPSPIVPVPPPRTREVPRVPVEPENHFVVNPRPPRRQDR